MFMHNGDLHCSKGREYTLRLPVDEDDYLMPSPGPIGGHNGPYMELMGDKPDNAASAKEYLRYLAEQAQLNGMDNMEYHLMQQEHDYINTANRMAAAAAAVAAGQPPPTPQQVNMPTGGPQVIHVVGQRSKPPSASDEDTSDDHDYYNDFDKLQRELQPLNHRRTANETTV